MSSDDWHDQSPGDFPKDHLWPWDPNDFMNIEDYLDAVGTTTVRQLLGNPSFRSVSEIPEHELEGEVERILDMLLEYRIEVDCRECSLAETYRFLTTDIMEEEIEDPPAPGWSSVFVYGMIHPGEEARREDEFRFGNSER
jgi:hypothetical protein